ncbi:hypothetical protein N9B55_01535, partial [Vicingaceae bacterium]|nr:hypothetical protein [Vicingaceae bacterium]
SRIKEEVEENNSNTRNSIVGLTMGLFEITRIHLSINNIMLDSYSSCYQFDFTTKTSVYE